MHPYEELVRKQYEYFTAGDVQGLLSVLSDDLVVHVPPGHQLSGDHHGSREFVENFVGKVVQLTGGVQLTLHDVATSDDHAVGLYRIHAQRDGRTYEWAHANVYHFDGGRIAEIWWTPFDQTTVAALFA